MDGLSKRWTGWMTATTQNKPEQLVPGVGSAPVDKDNAETHQSVNKTIITVVVVFLERPVRSHYRLLDSHLIFDKS